MKCRFQAPRKIDNRNSGWLASKYTCNGCAATFQTQGRGETKKRHGEKSDMGIVMTPRTRSRPITKQLNGESEIVPRSNVRRLLKNLNDSVDDRLSEFLKGTPYERVRPSDAQVIVNVSRGYESIASLSRELGISRQAIHMSAKRLQGMGLVELKEIPNNKRDKRIAISSVGHKQIKRGAKELQTTEAELANAIGAANYAKFRKQLIQLDDFLLARRKTLRKS
jgi:DNA-binding MarR family transcriptional regulator